jgi:hypothetical protein
VKKLGFVSLLLAFQMSITAQNTAQDATILFYTVDAPSQGSHLIVYHGGKELGEVSKAQFMRLVLSPGTYEFSLREDAPTTERLSLSPRAGQQLFFRVAAGGFFMGNATEAIANMPTTTASDSRKPQSSTMKVEPAKPPVIEASAATPQRPTQPPITAAETTDTKQQTQPAKLPLKNAQVKADTVPVQEKPKEKKAKIPTATDNLKVVTNEQPEIEQRAAEPVAVARAEPQQSQNRENTSPATIATKSAASAWNPTRVPPGAKVFIDKMESQLDGFIAAEILKKKVPVVVVTEEAAADYIMTGGSLKADDEWFHTIFGGKDKNEGNVQLLSVKEKSLVWAGEAGDRSLWFGSLKRGGQRKVADRLIDKMKKDLFEK